MGQLLYLYERILIILSILIIICLPVCIYLYTRLRKQKLKYDTSRQCLEIGYQSLSKQIDELENLKNRIKEENLLLKKELKNKDEKIENILKEKKDELDDQKQKFQFIISEMVVTEEQSKAKCEKLKLEMEEFENNYETIKKKLEDKHLLEQELRSEIEILKAERNRAKEIPPIKRGGRSREPGPIETEPITSEKNFKAELVCWKKDQQWTVGLECATGDGNDKIKSLTQNDIILKQDDDYENHWPVENLTGSVRVTFFEDDKSTEIKICSQKENYHIFKLKGGDLACGRRVQMISWGNYFIVVPDYWQYDSLSDIDAVTSFEPLGIDGYVGYLFNVSHRNEGEIFFTEPSSGRVKIESGLHDIELIGNRIIDNNEKIGPLFGNTPPKIRSLDRWQNVEKIIVGEEGSGQGRWRTQLDPNKEDIEQELPPEIIEQGRGWYFLRFYNENSDLIESFDFRFIEDLKEVKIINNLDFPPEGGHIVSKIEFHHCDGCEINQVPIENHLVEYLCDDCLTTAFLPSNHSFDETKWQIKSRKGCHANITICLNRIWWIVGEENIEPLQWKDRIIKLTKDDFKTASNKALWIKLSGDLSSKNIYAEFDGSLVKEYFKKKNNASYLPLKDFEGVEHVLNSHGEKTLNLVITSDNTFLKGVICTVEPFHCCKYCEYNTIVSADFLTHVTRHHFKEFFRQLDYEEMKTHVPSLPYKIYKCSYCPTYVESGDRLKNPTSTILNHLEECPRAVRDAYGAVKHSFRIIEDVSEIRDLFIKNLPYLYKCRLCNYVTEKNPRDSELIKHLAEEHKDEIFKFT